jgi:organic radical activating enzyme
MQKIVEWELTMKCNYTCNYCTNLDQSIQPVRDKKIIFDFIKMLGDTYPGTEIFLFGGEPFLHPDIEYIIDTFNELKVPFVIQTNFSKKSVVVMERLTSNFNINISVHPEQIKLNTLLELFSKDLPHINKKIIDVMYTGNKAIEYYVAIKKLLKDHKDLYLTPITDFGDGVSDKLLKQYNNLRESKLHRHMIDFEEVKEFGEYRSILWADKDFVTKDKPCLYNDRYYLYGSDLRLNNCCYREYHDGICRHEKCFLM